MKSSNPLDWLAERIFGPVWGVRVADFVVCVLSAAETIAGHGFRRVFAAVMLALFAGMAAINAWERAHPRPKRRRSRERPPEQD